MNDNTATLPKPRRRWPWILGLTVTAFVGIGIGAASGGARPVAMPVAPPPVTITQAAPPPVTITAPAPAPVTETTTVTEPAPAAVTITKQAPAPAAEADSGGLRPGEISEGTYQAGSDIKPGLWKTDGPKRNAPVAEWCWWFLQDNPSGSNPGYLGSDTMTGGPSVVNVPKGKYFKVSGHCTWHQG